jgi:methyltransferase (TIGR00027 family)
MSAESDVPLDGPTVDDPTWAFDQEERADPGRLTERFHSSVPVLGFLGWKVTKTARGFAQTVLPLNVASTNQHITHQAAVILIAADYTGGIALGTLLDGVPLVGIHSQSTDYGAYLWGAKADITWIRPSVDDLVCTASIDKGRHGQIVRRFFGGRRVLETVRIDMTNAGELVAVANLAYWVQDTHALRRNAFDAAKVHPLFDHRQRASARLIAGLRGLEQEKAKEARLFEDPVASTLAGNHGMILARRFCRVAPQLQSMVAARTRHLDDIIGSVATSTPYQIVNIGSGLDSRSYRLSLPRGTKTYDVDLPLMLKRRREALDSPSMPPCHIERVDVPVDLRVHELSRSLTSAGFVPSKPALVIWEGGSMYFTGEDNARIMRSIATLLKHPDSLFWMDYVHPSVVDGTSTIPEVVSFTDAIRCLGEPFIAGFTDIDAHLRRAGLGLREDVASDYLVGGGDRGMFRLYRFAVAGRLNPTQTRSSHPL